MEIRNSKRLKCKMIKEAFVSFEVAKLLKEIGFDELCRYLYEDNGKRYTLATTCYQNVCDDNECLCPTQQMVMRWLREEYNIILVFKPAPFSGENCTFWTYELWCGDNFEGEILSFKTYEEAVEAALKYVLENVIK